MALFGEKRSILCFLVFLFVSGVMNSRAHALYDKIEESECDRNKDGRFFRCRRAGEPSDNYREIEHDEYKVNAELCKIRFDEFDLENEIAERVYCGEEQYIPEIGCIENLIACGVCDRDKSIEEHNDECEIKARVPQKAFYL